MMHDIEIAAIISKIESALIYNFHIWARDNLPPLFDGIDDDVDFYIYYVVSSIRAGALY